MTNKTFDLMTRAILVLLLTGSIGALAQSATPKSFRGLINDYSPETTVTPTGPWEIRGSWELTVDPASSTANFSAELNMEMSDYTLVCCGIDPDSPAERMPHTHLITVVGGQVTQLTGGGFEVSGGTVEILKNGSPVLTPSTLTIDLTGGTTAAYSNITLTFGGDAGGHFGTQPVNGFVERVQ
jgi:hypothetical protein